MQGHKILEKEGILHEIAENYLSKDDREKLFDTTVGYYEWYKNKPILKDLEMESVNLLSILDTGELHNYLIKVLKDFLIIKRIIEKEKPKKIIVTTNFSIIVKSILNENSIDLKVYDNSLPNYFEYDRLQIGFNIGQIPLSIRLSRTMYAIIKSSLESILCSALNLWHDVTSKKKTILLLEFDPVAYQDLLFSLSKSDKNIILVNRRRSAIWNFESIKILRNSKCKLLNVKELLKSESKDRIIALVSFYLEKLEKLWSEDDFFMKLFTIEDYSFWPCIKKVLINLYERRISEYVTLIMISKEIFEKINLSCIVCLNIFGETEKAILNMNKNNIPSILLEHGYADYTPHEVSRFDALSMYPYIQDKIAVWGSIQKEYLAEHRGLSSDRILVTGSPRHDRFFKKKIKNNTKQQKIILFTFHPITETSGQADTNLYIKFENFVKKFCTIIKKIPNVKIIAKLHPGQDEHNNDIKALLKEIDPSIPVYQFTPIIKLIESCDVLINLSAEGYDISTIILEGLILNKPTMNVILDGNFYEFQYVKDNAVLSISDKTDIEKSVKDILFNEELRSRLLQNAKQHVNKYLTNRGNASEYLAGLLNSL